LVTLRISILLQPTKIKNLWGILQTGINQDGRAASPMTAPSSKQQQKLLHSVYGKYKVNPKDLDYIEVHGKALQIFENILKNIYTCILLMNSSYFCIPYTSIDSICAGFKLRYRNRNVKTVDRGQYL
jgi:hypothetical protein